jgi:hypothetical protein
MIETGRGKKTGRPLLGEGEFKNDKYYRQIQVEERFRLQANTRWLPASEFQRGTKLFPSFF